MSYKKYNFTTISKDFNSPFIRNFIWVKAFFSYPSIVGIQPLMAGIYSSKDSIEYLADMDAWTICHKEVVNKIESGNLSLDKLISHTNKLGEKFNKWTENKIFKTNLNNLNPEELVSLMDEFVERQGELYAYGVILPILDYQNTSFVEDRLNKFLESKVAGSDLKKYFSVFTHPSFNSFSQDQEEDLFRLISKFYSDKGWLESVRSKNLVEIKKLYPRFYKILQKHTEKYCWVYYVYAGPAFTEKDFLDFIVDYIDKGIDPGYKLKSIQKEKASFNELKKIYIKNLQPNKFERLILDQTGKFVWAKPRRKDYQSKSYYHLEKLTREIASRLYISVPQARSIPIKMLFPALKAGEIDVDILNDVYNYHVCLPNDDGTVEVLYGKKAKEYSEKNIKREEFKNEYADVTELRGEIASLGVAKGSVKIINSPSDMNKMEDGDVLVSVATTPAIISAMKKASAFVTDEGGLTCHAAIVSRELNKPCVTGTKFATQFFRDGDIVEVDAGNGIVRKL